MCHQVLRGRLANPLAVAAHNGTYGRLLPASRAVHNAGYVRLSFCSAIAFGEHLLVSECDRRHIPNGAVRAVTRHTSNAMLAVYDRPGELFSGSAGAYFEGV